MADTEGGASGGDGAGVDEDEDQDGDHPQDQVLHGQADTQHLGQVGHLLTRESYTSLLLFISQLLLTSHDHAFKHLITEYNIITSALLLCSSQKLYLSMENVPVTFIHGIWNEVCFAP